ncbi:MAG: hypothetical protein ACRYF2_05875 [Janthinobacterium lividum]
MSQANLERFLLSIGVFTAMWLLRRFVRTGLELVIPGESGRVIVARFWGHQFINIGSFAFVVVALASIWFEDQSRKKVHIRPLFKFLEPTPHLSAVSGNAHMLTN